MNPGSSTVNTPGRRVAELVQYVTAQVIPHPVNVPAGDALQSLHPIRAHRSGVLGHRRAVPALQTSQQAPQVVPDPPPRLGPPKPLGDQLHQRVQRGNPPGKIDHA